MPLRHYLFVLVLAIAAAAGTIAVAAVLLPGQEWAGPAVMAVLAVVALIAHAWMRRK